MKKILTTLPKSVKTEYGKLWAEYQQGSTKEAKLLHQIDKLEMVLQAEHYKKKGYTKKQLEPFFDSAKKGITDHVLKRLCKI